MLHRKPAEPKQQDQNTNPSSQQPTTLMYPKADGTGFFEAPPGRYRGDDGKWYLRYDDPSKLYAAYGKILHKDEAEPSPLDIPDWKMYKK